jgi:hypothetical protein
VELHFIIMSCQSVQSPIGFCEKKNPWTVHRNSMGQVKIPTCEITCIVISHGSSTLVPLSQCVTLFLFFNLHHHHHHTTQQQQQPTSPTDNEHHPHQQTTPAAPQSTTLVMTWHVNSPSRCAMLSSHTVGTDNSNSNA